MTKYIAMRNYYKLTSGAEIRRLVEAGERATGRGRRKRETGCGMTKGEAVELSYMH